MSDSMWSYSWGNSGTPARVLRQQKKAIRQAGKKLAEIDNQYSTKVLKDDIEAETLLTDLSPSQTVTVVWTTVGGVIIDSDDKVILVENNRHIRGFPKGNMETGETELETLFREIKEETGLAASQLSKPIKIGEYLAFSPDMQGIKKYIFYSLRQLKPWIILTTDPNDKTLLRVDKFDTEIILDIIGSEHQKKFWKENQANIIYS